MWQMSKPLHAYLDRFSLAFTCQPENEPVAAWGERMIPALLWAEEQFGSPGADARWTHTSLCVFFRHHDDAFAFRLRWC